MVSPTLLGRLQLAGWSVLGVDYIFGSSISATWRASTRPDSWLPRARVIRALLKVFCVRRVGGEWIRGGREHAARARNQVGHQLCLLTAVNEPLDVFPWEGWSYSTHDFGKFSRRLGLSVFIFQVQFFAGSEPKLPISLPLPDLASHDRDAIAWNPGDPSFFECKGQYPASAAQIYCVGICLVRSFESGYSQRFRHLPKPGWRFLDGPLVRKNFDRQAPTATAFPFTWFHTGS